MFEIETNTSFKRTREHRNERDLIGNREEVNIEVMGDQQGIELVNQSTTTRVCAENRNVMSDSQNTSRLLSFSKLEVALMIAVAILAILSTVFMAMYFTTGGNTFRCQNDLKNKSNEINKSNVACTTNKLTLDNGVTDCKVPLQLGVENGEILDGQITASSEWNANHGPANGRVNFKAGGGRTGAWSSLPNDLNQWLQVDFELQATVTEIMTQGRSDANQWVKSYAVTYSNNGVFFDAYQKNGTIMVFPGNRDRNTIIRQTISPVIIARYIRIHPKSWTKHISMRVDFVGCLKEWACKPNPCLNGATCIEYHGSYLCSCATDFAGRNCETLQGPCPNKTG